MLTINKQLISINYSKGVTIKPKFIVIHDTDNRKPGATAQANRNYFANHINANASAHYICDDGNIIQALEDTWKGWHVGDDKDDSDDGCNNNNSIGIEICVNEDGDYEKALQNTIELTQCLMAKYNIDIDHVVTHNFASGKNCPRKLLESGRWQEFKNRVSNNSAPTQPQIPTPQPSKNSVTYQVHISNRWLPNVIDLSDYAGIFGNSIDCVYVNASCDIKTRVHVKGGNWLPWVSQREDYAGIYGKVIDGIQVDSSKKVKYRVYTTRWLPWVYNLEDYAGIYGQDITGLQIVFD